MLWAALDPDKFRRPLRTDVRFLTAQQNDHGSWGYGLIGIRAAPRGWADYSNSQLAILALREADQVGGEISRFVWERAERAWLDGQQTDGGWGYLPPENPYQLRRKSYGSMTAAGLATLYILYDQLYVRSAGRFDGVRIKNCGRDLPQGRDLLQAMDQAWNWMNLRFVADANPDFPGGRHKPFAEHWLTYYLYSVERAGVTSGFKTFGPNNWYRDLAVQLVGSQRPDGSWGNIDQTCFGLLALVKGRTPIVVNKLRYGRGEEWNTTPRDAAGLTRWLSRKLETPVTWQIVELDSPGADVKDAPILYLAGHSPPELSSLEGDLLRDYVFSGGTILAVACCSKQHFASGVEAMFDELFPRLRRHVLEPDHPLWSMHYPLKSNKQITGYSDNCRTRIFVVRRGVNCAWHQNMFAKYENMFELGANLMLYATDRTAPRSVAAGMGRGHIAGLGPSPEVQPDGSPRQPAHTIKLGRVKHDGDYWVDPYALSVLSNDLTRSFDLAIREAESVDLLYDHLEPFDVLWLSGTELVIPDEDRLHRLKLYLEEGGTLIATACCSRPTFDEPFVAMIERMYGPGALVGVPPDDPLITGRFAVTDPPTDPSVVGPLGSELTDLRMKPRRSPAASTPYPGLLPTALLKGVRLTDSATGRDRWAVIYSPIDIHVATGGHYCVNCDGYQPRDARAVAGSLVLYAYLQAQR
jgi:hypothetical protein